MYCTALHKDYKATFHSFPFTPFFLSSFLSFFLSSLVLSRFFISYLNLLESFAITLYLVLLLCTLLKDLRLYMSQSPNDNHTPIPSFTSRLATSANGLARDAFAINPRDMSGILPGGDCAYVVKSVGPALVALPHRGEVGVATHVRAPIRRFEASGIAKRKARKRLGHSLRSRDVAWTQQVQQDEDKIREFLCPENTDVKRWEYARESEHLEPSQTRGGHEGHDEAGPPRSTPAQDTNIHTNPQHIPNSRFPSLANGGCHTGLATLISPPKSPSLSLPPKDYQQPHRHHHMHCLTPSYIPGPDVTETNWVTERLERLLRPPYNLSSSLITEVNFSSSAPRTFSMGPATTVSFTRRVRSMGASP